MKDLRSGDINNRSFLDLFEKEEDVSYLTGILAEDFNITDIDKLIEDISNNIKKDKLESKKYDILHKLKTDNLTNDETNQLERELSNIIIELAKFK